MFVCRFSEFFVGDAEKVQDFAVQSRFSTVKKFSQRLLVVRSGFVEPFAQPLQYRRCRGSKGDAAVVVLDPLKYFPFNVMEDTIFRLRVNLKILVL